MPISSHEFKAYITNSEILTHSFSGKGCPYDNDCIESFHAPLKKGEVQKKNPQQYKVYNPSAV